MVCSSFLLLQAVRQILYIYFSLLFRCFSITGKSGGKQNLSLGKGCGKKGVVIHELLHALGMMHEHCRADRDQFIRINFDNIKPSENYRCYIFLPTSMVNVPD